MDDLLHEAVRTWDTDPVAHEAALAGLAARPEPARAVTNRLLGDVLEGLWQRGWTPRDVVHVAARHLSPAHATLASELAVADGRRRVDRGQALHPRWAAQLAALASGDTGGAAPLDAADLGTAVVLLCLLARLTEVPQTVPPPGEAAGVPIAAGALDERVLARVRALLAKAEATEFDAEAEALTAKAQELIARHAIDEALLHTAADVGEPSVRRIPVDDPYADAKASLFGEVADANRCRVVYSPDYGWVTVFGYEHDLDAVELLTASLQAQATSAMARQGPRRDAAGRSRTRSFRRAFLFGFAHRIGQRLREATDRQVTEAPGRDRLLPVLSAREDRLREAASAAFPHIIQKTSSVTNAGGYAAGQVAADLADLDVSAGALRDAATLDET